jgi:hypothetical protein
MKSVSISERLRRKRERGRERREGGMAKEEKEAGAVLGGGGEARVRVSATEGAPK